MAITKTGQAAEQAEKNLASRTISNPFLTEEQRRLVGTIPTTTTRNVFGTNIQVQNKDLPFTEQVRAIANQPTVVTQKGGELVAPTNQAALQSAVANVGSQKYQTPEQAAAYIKSLQSALGVKAPQESAQEIRDAAVTQLQEAAHRQAVADASGLASRGLGDSAIGAALSQLRGTRLAGEKTQALAGISLADQARMDAYNRQLLGDAMQAGAQQSQFGAQQAQAGLQAQQSLADDEFRRRQAAYEAQLAQIQQANTADLAAIQKRQANVSAGLGLFGDLANTAASATVGGITAARSK
jgi:hypothetical protein